MKVVERIFEHRIWQQIEIDDMQLGFMKGKGTTDAIFMASDLLSRGLTSHSTLYRSFRGRFLQAR